MLSERSYMRSDYPRRTTSAVVWLIAVLISAFVMELILLSPWFGNSGATLMSQLALTVRSVQSGHVWTLLSHSLLHSTVNPFHILSTLLGVIFIGREVEPLLGSKRFLSVFVTALFAGALCWTAVHWTQGGVHVGASAGIIGLFTVLVCLYPNQEINFMVFFLFPITIRPKYLAYGLLAFNAIGLLLFEIPGTAAPFDYAPSVQLGGMFSGWIYFRYFHANNGWDRAPTIDLPAWLPHRERPKLNATPSTNHPTKTPGNLRAEVDAILDKINSQGFGSLTEGEKRLLDEAKDMLSRP